VWSCGPTTLGPVGSIARLPSRLGGSLAEGTAAPKYGNPSGPTGTYPIDPWGNRETLYLPVLRGPASSSVSRVAGVFGRSAIRIMREASRVTAISS
jgi:hypothetical protein